MSLEKVDSAIDAAITAEGPRSKTTEFPPVYISPTYHELYSEGIDGPCDDTLCFVKPNADPRYGETVPFNKKYIIHSAQVATSSDLAHLQMEITSYLLAFYAGPMKVAFLACEGKTNDKYLTKKTVDSNAKRSFSVIKESLRPKVLSEYRTYANYEDFVKRHDGSKIRWSFAMDFADQLPSIDPPEQVYKLLSKRWLAVCNLKSANDYIIDVDIDCPDHFTLSAGEKLWYYGGQTCRACNEGIEKEVYRVRDTLSARPPYVLKLTQSLSSVGTLIAKDEKKRTEIIEYMDGYLRDYLPRITKENAFLRTTSLILSEFVPGETMALNFFVKRSGETLFLGACHQQSTGESGRQATAITYADQDKLEQKYRKIVDDMGRALHEEGYYGPCGADIMEKPDDGSLFVIDLNVRSALSLVLYLLKDHINVRRGHKMSLVYECLMLKIDRDTFEGKFRREFEESEIVLLGSTRLSDKEQWAYGMVVAGTDQKAIDELSDRILEWEIDGGQGGDVADAAA